jgi:hypothetical protein
MKGETPFPTTGYTGPENFSDREEEAIDKLLEWTDVHTYYVQLLCNRIYHSGNKRINSLAWKEEAIRIMEEIEHTYYNIRNSMKTLFLRLLKIKWMMIRILVFCFLMLATGACLEVETINQSCTVVMNDGTIIEISRDIRRNRKTGTITYRDENDKLWSIFQEDYESYSCGSN